MSWLGKRKFKDYSVILFKDILSQMQFGFFFIGFFFKEFVKSNFYVFLLQKAFWLTNNFICFFNFFCLYEG